MTFNRARDVLNSGALTGVFPAGVAEVGTAASILWRHWAGRLTDDGDSPPASLATVFDLASLTKVIATTSLIMRLVDAGRLGLDDRVSTHLASWRGADRAAVTLADLLSHSGGLTGWGPLYEACRGRAEVEAAIADLPLEYAPRSRSVYSDLGFMLLGFIVEDAGAAGLAAQFAQHVVPVLNSGGDETAPGGLPWRIGFTPPPAWRPEVAPTEREPWRGRLLVGEVHDANAWVLGGVAGHAGLFGTAPAVGAFARAVLRTLDRGSASGPVLSSVALARRIVRRTGTPGSSRALGWDTMLPGSSCGARLSPRSIGHTGFTGTSLWIDLDRGIYVVLLTNRVCPTRDNDAITRFRPAFHDAVIAGLEGG